MKNWPSLAILIVTYNRRETLLGTIEHLATHLDYQGERVVVIADDGSDDGTQEMAGRGNVCYVRSNRSGLGANTNAGLRAAFEHSPFVLQLQDDMHLLAHLDLHPHVEKLRDDETSGFIRLWGIGGHRYTATLEGNFWRVDWKSDELYIPSDRPHLKHKRFHDAVGFYPEGRLTAETEEAWCHQVRDKALASGVPSVLVPQGIDTERSWEHMEWHNRWRDQGL